MVLTLKVGLVCPDCKYIDLAVNQTFFGRFCLLCAWSRDMAKILFGITGTQVGPASSFNMGAGQLDSQYLHTTHLDYPSMYNNKKIIDPFFQNPSHKLGYG